MNVLSFFFFVLFWACCFPKTNLYRKGKEAAVKANPGAPGDEIPRHGGKEEEEGTAGGQPQRGFLPDGVLPHLPAGSHPSTDVDFTGVYVVRCTPVHIGIIHTKRVHILKLGNNVVRFEDVSIFRRV